MRSPAYTLNTLCNTYGFHIYAQLLLSTGMHSTNCQQESSLNTVVSWGCTGSSIVNTDCVHVTRGESVAFTKRQTYIPFCCSMLLSLESLLLFSSNGHRCVHTAYCSLTLGWVSYSMHGEYVDVRSDVNISTFSLGTCLEQCSWTLHLCEYLYLQPRYMFRIVFLNTAPWENHWFPLIWCILLAIEISSNCCVRTFYDAHTKHPSVSACLKCCEPRNAECRFCQ